MRFLVESSGKMQVLDKLLTKLKKEGHRSAHLFRAAPFPVRPASPLS